MANKVYEYGKLYGADVALVIYQKGRYYSYLSPSGLCFPPSKKETAGSLLTSKAFYYIVGLNPSRRTRPEAQPRATV